MHLAYLKCCACGAVLIPETTTHAKGKAQRLEVRAAKEAEHHYMAEHPREKNAEVEWIKVGTVTGPILEA